MISTEKLWVKLRSKRYRDQFVSAQARRTFAFQLRAIMKRRKISQEELAEKAGLTQGVISRAADPNYGKLTTTVMVKIANGLDMAYLPMLIPFTNAVEWAANLSEESVQVRTFPEEPEALTRPDLGHIPESEFGSGSKPVSSGFKPVGTSALERAMVPSDLNGRELETALVGRGTRNGAY